MKKLPKFRKNAFRDFYSVLTKKLKMQEIVANRLATKLEQQVHSFFGKEEYERKSKEVFKMIEVRF